jgi:hypothetical protein
MHWRWSDMASRCTSSVCKRYCLEETNLIRLFREIHIKKRHFAYNNFYIARNLKTVPGLLKADIVRHWSHGLGEYQKFQILIFPTFPPMKRKPSDPMRDLHRLLDAQNFESLEDLQKFMQSMTGKPIPEFDAAELTPQQRA